MLTTERVAHTLFSLPLGSADLAGHRNSDSGHRPGGSLSGRVLDAVMGTLVSGAEVSLDNWNTRVSTRPDGQFSITNHRVR